MRAQRWAGTVESFWCPVKEAGFHPEGNGEPLQSLGGGNMILHFIKQSLVGGEESRLEAGRPASRLL